MLAKSPSTKQLADNFDESMLLCKRSGKHVRKSEKADMKKIIGELLSQNASTITPGRSYGCFSKVEPTLLSGFNLQKYFSWINDHKQYMILHRKAR